MIQTVLFRKTSIDLHRKIKAKSAITEVPMYELYNQAMERFSTKMKKDNLPINYTYGPTNNYKDIRVEKVDSEVYKGFKISCIQKDISISQGINLALASWLENQNDASDLGLR